MIFRPHAIAYLDILCFSRFVEEAEIGPDKMKCLDKLFNEVIPREVSSEGKNSRYPKDLELKCLSYSDSFVVSAPVLKESSYPALIAVSIKSIQIAHALLDMGFLIRGALAVGNVYRTDSNILGMGFQEAVKSEKDTENPRIVLTESAEQERIKLKNEGSWEGYWNSSFFSKDGEQTILNSIHPHQSYFPDKNGDPGDYFRTYCETILKNLSHDNEKIRQKWIWLARLFNANRKLFSSIIGQEPPPAIDIDENLPPIILNYLNLPEQNTKFGSGG